MLRGVEQAVDITIVAVGKVKEKYITAGIEKFKKELDRYCRLVVTEVPDCMAPTGLSPLQLQKTKDKEGREILRQIKPGDHVIALDVGGKPMTSRRMAGYISSLADNGIYNIAFIIGGSNGLSKQVLDRADLKLSFSAMTFPHQLVRLILLEQICRWLRSAYSS